MRPVPVVQIKTKKKSMKEVKIENKKKKKTDEEYKKIVHGHAN